MMVLTPTYHIQKVQQLLPTDQAEFVQFYKWLERQPQYTIPPIQEICTHGPVTIHIRYYLYKATFNTDFAECIVWNGRPSPLWSTFH